ncbi:hypothetical protein GW17_00022711 [Ensete ventricosum]|nr:hypothetical protein GW17_00022711 [Ensete ventricosum]
MKTEMATTRKRSVKVCARKPEREEELTAGGETMGSYKYCMCFTRKFLWNAAQPPADVREAFAAHAGGAAQMGADQLQRFLAEAQGEAAATLADAERIVDLLRRRHHLPSVLARAGITLDDFFHFLFSDDLNPPVRSQVGAALPKPIQEKLGSCDLTAASISQLPHLISHKQRGCFCGLNFEPLMPRSPSISFMIRCLRSIKEFAFCASPYPVVITLEDHLTANLQAKVAQVSVAQFIISTKPPKEYLEAKNIRDKEDDSQRSGKVSNDEETWGNDISDLKAFGAYNDKVQHYFDYLEDQISIQCRMRDALKVDPHKVRRLSLSEQQLEKLAESHGPDIVRFTQKNILRVYPKGTRFNSSNYNPLLGWMHGAQMVAFNMQALYILHISQTDFDAYSPPDFYTKVKIKCSLHLTSLNGRFPPTLHQKICLLVLNKVFIDLQVGIAGVPADTKMKKTKIKEDNWTPVWEEEFSFPLTVPELALLRIVVHEYDMSDKNDFGGQTCLPVWELRPGIRAVPLHDRKGNKYKSVRLLMRFQFE